MAIPFLCLAQLCLAQPKAEVRQPVPLDPVRAEKAGRELVADLLTRKPDRNSTNSGVVRIRHASGKRWEIPARFEIAFTPTNWVSIYETEPKGEAPKERLTVIHAAGQPNQYQFCLQNPTNSSLAESKSLTGDQVMTPFAGSDFWVVDLGLEFLHWPKQRVLKNDMKHSQSCDVLESVNPHPGTNSYARVLSWIGVETGAIVHAEAYDIQNELLKQFDPTDLKKVDGERQLEEMEMRNRKTGSHTWIKFDLK